jgi:plastocyanin
MRLLIRRTFAIVMLLLPLLALSTGCVGSADRATSPVHYIQIRDTIFPMDLYVSVGDQVRWQNLRGEPVKIGLLPGVDLEKTSCEKGFRNFGVMDDFVTIKPREYVSLCFVRPGLVRYNVWLDPNDTKGNITKTAVIHIERRS